MSSSLLLLALLLACAPAQPGPDVQPVAVSDGDATSLKLLP